jgi:Ca-activated chloride channel homolog
VKRGGASFLFEQGTVYSSIPVGILELVECGPRVQQEPDRTQQKPEEWNMKQIILITDGCSNVGIDPVIAAAEAKEEGIIVHVIGVIDQGEIGELGATEIAEIAKAGGGLSRIVTPGELSQTVQMMTRKTVTNTIQQAVQKELRHLLGGGGGLTELPPEQRGHVVQAVENLAENVDLRVALLVDASASMKPKLSAVQEAVQDLMISLRARTGLSELCVFRFPGLHGTDAQLDLNWTRELAKVPNLFYKINMRGTTPTGPALLQVVRHVAGRPSADRPADKDGMLSEYII